MKRTIVQTRVDTETHRHMREQTLYHCRNLEIVCQVIGFGLLMTENYDAYAWIDAVMWRVSHLVNIACLSECASCVLWSDTVWVS